MRLTLCLEQTLGHRAHTNNLTNAWAGGDAEIDVIRVDFRKRGPVPWAFDASWQAAQVLRRKGRQHDVCFYHTQSTALFAPFVARDRPFVVSVDATPRQIDAIGRWYNHHASSGTAERLKMQWYRSVFHRSAAVVAWSNWAADSLVADYGVQRQRITVVHPGAPPDFFTISRPAKLVHKPKMLFVGGDLRRKGGDLLLEVFDQLRDQLDLIMVTPDHVQPRPGLEVISNANPGSSRLRDAFQRADFFCLPTRGDCTPLVLGEAMAASLPVITTRIGSNGETVRDGIDGILIERDDSQALRSAIELLSGDHPLRASMGTSAHEAAEERLHAQRNADRILDLLRSVAQ